MVGKRWVSSAVGGNLAGSVPVQSVPVCVESKVVPFGIRTLMEGAAGLMFSMCRLSRWPKWCVHPVSAMSARGV